ncbi:MAG: hypothetical protein ACK5L8_05650 [Marinicella pacifica]
MKKMLTVSLFMLSASVFAMDAEQLKESDLQACQSKAQSVPEGSLDQFNKTCECEVENTDYEALAEARKSGDLKKVKALKAEAAEKCEVDVM